MPINMSGKGLRQLQVLNHPFRLLLSEEPLPRVGPRRARPPSSALPGVEHFRTLPSEAAPSLGAAGGGVAGSPAALGQEAALQPSPQGDLGVQSLGPAGGSVGPESWAGWGAPGEDRARSPRPGPIPVCGKGSVHASLLLRWPGASPARVRAVPLGVLEWGAASQQARLVQSGGASQAPGGCPLTLAFPEWLLATPGCSDGCDPQGLGSSRSDPRPAHRDTGTKHTCVLAGVRLVLPGPSSKSRALRQRGEGSKGGGGARGGARRSPGDGPADTGASV